MNAFEDLALTSNTMQSVLPVLHTNRYTIKASSSYLSNKCSWHLDQPDPVQFTSSHNSFKTCMHFSVEHISKIERYFRNQKLYSVSIQGNIIQQVNCLCKIPKGVGRYLRCAYCVCGALAPILKNIDLYGERESRNIEQKETNCEQ